MEELWLSGHSVLAALVALAVMLVLIGRNRIKTRSKSRRLPGPWGWPVLGCIPRLGRLPHRTLAEFGKRYGPLMFMKMGSVNVVVASSSKVAEEFLKTHDRIWAHRSPPTAAKIVTYLCNGIVWTEYGPRWRYLRKVFTLELFTAQRLSAFQGVRKEEIVRGINEAIITSESGWM
ncbi:hypothetical protein R1sor_026166 [Riccia sorocarpa]|uniref:Uncharacterized protein n=1 Tax=Riccia sorocarpa TaxID=122646 RepID=A0ABD3GAN1_9MARC